MRGRVREWRVESGEYVERECVRSNVRVGVSVSSSV